MLRVMFITLSGTIMHSGLRVGVVLSMSEGIAEVVGEPGGWNRASRVRCPCNYTAEAESDLQGRGIYIAVLVQAEGETWL